MPKVKRSEHTVGRSERIDLGPLRLIRHRSPDTDPYDIDFDQHDDSLYTTSSYWARLGRLSVEWRVKDA